MAVSSLLLTSLGLSFLALSRKSIDAGLHRRCREGALAPPPGSMNRYEQELFLQGGAAEVVARCAHQARLESESRHFRGDDPSLAQPICSVFAPLLTAFCEWVVAECRRNQIEHVFFLARDGEVFQKISRRLEGDASGIYFHYLYVSRRSLQLPALDSVASPPDWMVEECGSLQDLASGLECGPSQIRDSVHSLRSLESLESPGFADLPEQERREILGELMADPGFAQLLSAQSIQARQAAIQYLRDSGFCDLKRVAVVDVGWRGSQQLSLRTIADIGGLRLGSIHGFYLFRTADQCSEPDTSDGFLCNPLGPEACAFYYRYRQVIEAALGSTHASTRGYRVDVAGAQPQLEPGDAITSAAGAKQHQGMLAFVDCVKDANAARDLSGLMGLRDVLSSNLSWFLSRPQDKDALAFSSHVFVHCHMTGKVQPVVQLPSVGEILFGRVHQLGVWPEASLVIMSKQKRQALRLRRKLGALRWWRKRDSARSAALF